MQHYMALAAQVPATTGGDDATTFDITQLLQFGLLGLIFLCLVMKKYVVPEWSLTQAKDAATDALAAKDALIATLEEDKTELKESLAQLQSLTRDQIIPALVRSNQLSADYVSELARQKRRDDDDASN